MKKSDVFDLLGVCLAALFAYAIWPPLTILVFALACFAAGSVAHRDRRARNQ